MKAKSFLLTVPLAVSALLSLSLPANAVCWSWKPCADYRGDLGYGAPPTESQSGLPPLPPGRRHGSAGSGRGAGKSETEEARSHGEGRGDSRTSPGEAEAGSSPGTSQGNSASGTSTDPDASTG